MTPEERIAAALRLLDRPRACVADLASVDEAVAILRGEDGLRAGEWTATHTGPLAAGEMAEDAALGSQKGPAPG